MSLAQFLDLSQCLTWNLLTEREAKSPEGSALSHHVKYIY